MMVKMKTGRSFQHTSAYILGATKKQYPTILMMRGIDLEYNDALAVNRGEISRKRIREIAKYIGDSFGLQASCKPRNKPVRHYMMTFPSSDAPLLKDNNHLCKIVKEYMDRIGICGTQYLVVRHSSTDNPHVHIVFNPVNDNAKVISESKQFSKNEKLCKYITAKYGLTFSNPRRYRAKNLKRLSGPDRNKAIVRIQVEEMLEISDTPRKFQENLLQRRIKLMLHQSNTGAIRGISFRYLDSEGKILREYKGSALSRTLSYNAILNYFKNKQEQKAHRGLKMGR